MISYTQIKELDNAIAEIAELYRQKVKAIVDRTSESEDAYWKETDLQELTKIREQLNLLFRIRDNCIKVLEDLALLKDTYCLLN